MLGALYPFKGLGTKFLKEEGVEWTKWEAYCGEAWGADADERLDKLAKGIKANIRRYEEAWVMSFGAEIGVEAKRVFEARAYEIYGRTKAAKEKVKKWDEKARRLQKKWEGGLKMCSAFSAVGEVESRLAKLEAGWKALIKEWLADVKDRVGEGGEKDAKNLRVEWYRSYADCRAKLKEVKSMNKAINQAKADTAKVLEGGGEKVGRSKVVKLKTLWKKYIKAWEQQWVVEHDGSKPDSHDKAEEVDVWYMWYKQLGELGIEMDRSALEAGEDMLL